MYLEGLTAELEARSKASGGGGTVSEQSMDLSGGSLDAFASMGAQVIRG